VCCVCLQYAGTLTPHALKGRDLAFFSIFAPHFPKTRVTPIEIRIIGRSYDGDIAHTPKDLVPNSAVYVDEVDYGERTCDDRRQCEDRRQLVSAT